MKMLRTLLVALAIGLATLPSAFAESLFLIGVEQPLGMTFKEASDGTKLEADSISGTIGYVELPMLGGFGVSNWDIAIKNTTNDVISGTTYDLMWVLPIPLISLGFGGGVGQAEVLGDNAANFESSTITQYFVRLGFSIFGPVQVRASWHQINNKLHNTTDDTYVEAGGQMTSVGLGIGF